MNAEIESTIRSMAEEIYGIACGVEMAQVMATYHLTKLLGMVNDSQREAIKMYLPSVVDYAMKRSLAEVDYAKHGARMKTVAAELAAL